MGRKEGREIEETEEPEEREEGREGKNFSVVVPLAIFATVVWDTVALRFGLWDFPLGSTSFWILGVPAEEYVLASGCRYLF